MLPSKPHLYSPFIILLFILSECQGFSYTQWSADILPPSARSEHFLHSTDWDKDAVSELFLRTQLTHVEGFYGARDNLNGSDWVEVVTLYEDFGCTTVSGDFNGDNYTDLVIGACTAENYGVVAVYYGNATGFPANYSHILAHPDATPGSNFGFCMAAGRLNNDTIDDLVITDYKFNNGSGRMWVFFGNSTNSLTTPDFAWNSHNFNGSHFGYECQVIDLDGDSLSEIVIGAPKYSNGQSQEGAIAVFYNTNGDFQQRIEVIEANVTNVLFGETVAACDVNGDGYGDLIAGVPAMDKVKVFYGSSQGIVIGLGWTQVIDGSTIPGYSSGFGHEISCVGSLNNDKTQEVLIGAYNASYLFVASPTGLVEPPEGVIPGYVLEILGVGDISGDGYGDIVMVFNGSVNYTLSLLTDFQNISAPVTGGVPSSTPSSSVVPSPTSSASSQASTSTTATPSLTPSSNQTSSNQGGGGGLSKAEAAATGAATGSSCMIIVVAGIIWYRRRKKLDDDDTDSELDEELEDPNHMVQISESASSNSN